MENHSSAIKYVGAVVVLMLILLAVLKTQEHQSPDARSQTSPQTDQSFFYYLTNYSPDPNGQNGENKPTHQIYKVFPDLATKTTLFKTVPLGSRSRFITESGKKNFALIVENPNSSSDSSASIYSVDITDKDSSPKKLLDVPLDSQNGQHVGSVRFLDNGASLAFVLQKGDSRLTDSVLYITPLNNPGSEEKIPLEIPLATSSPLYAGFGFLSATPDGKTLYLHETGGDGGFVWSQWYKVDRNTRIVQKLPDLPPMIKRRSFESGQAALYPAASAFSPDAKTLAYVDYSGEYSQTQECLPAGENGGVVMIKTLETGEVQEVFRNLSHKNNVCNNLARKILTVLWLDSNTIVFETIDAIYTLDLRTKKVQPIFTFENSSNPGAQTRPIVQSLSLPYIIFWGGQIAHTESNKIIDLLWQKGRVVTFF